MRSWLLPLVLVGCFGGVGGDVPTATATQGEFVSTLTIPGELRAVDSTSIAVPAINRQTKVTWVVEEGSRVAKGDVVVEFDRTELEKNLEDAQNALDVARTKIDQKKAQLAVRLADLENEVTRAELSLERARMRVTDSETVPRVERESAKIDVQESTISLERQRAALESARLEGQAELQLLELEAKQRETEVDKVEGEIAATKITAPADGLAILPEIWKGGSSGPVKAGDTVWRGTTIMELPDMSAMEVIAWVHEVDAGRIAAGQPVKVVIDAFPDPAHDGTVRRVADLAVKRTNDATVKHLKVNIDLAETAEVMKPGMTVRAEVETARVPGALTVPREAVFHTDGQAFVYQRGLTGWTRVAVQTGDTNDTHVVVTSGLESGVEVALIDPHGADGSASGGSPIEAANASP